VPLPLAAHGRATAAPAAAAASSEALPPTRPFPAAPEYSITTEYLHALERARSCNNHQRRQILGTCGAGQAREQELEATCQQNVHLQTGSTTHLPPQRQSALPPASRGFRLSVRRPIRQSVAKAAALARARSGFGSRSSLPAYPPLPLVHTFASSTSSEDHEDSTTELSQASQAAQVSPAEAPPPPAEELGVPGPIDAGVVRHSSIVTSVDDLGSPPPPGALVPLSSTIGTLTGRSLSTLVALAQASPPEAIPPAAVQPVVPAPIGMSRHATVAGSCESVNADDYSLASPGPSMRI